MSWVRLDDHFFLNPKVIAAGRDACYLYIAGLTYAAGKQTNGFLPAASIPIIAAMAMIQIGYGPGRAQNRAKQLVDVGLWEKCAGGFMIREYLDYNPSDDL